MTSKFIVFIDNRDYKASLDSRKLYERIDDEKAARHGQARVVDESGEDYLYPEDIFDP
jgi:hypothetical protein|tara:strand:- start:426 stop:599 length:174 start_codon:yes stop_codon:yes gene_type:complete